MGFLRGWMSFDTTKQGWDLGYAKEPWKEWFLLIQKMIELVDGGFMEHCVVCATLSAWMRGEPYIGRRVVTSNHGRGLLQENLIFLCSFV